MAMSMQEPKIVLERETQICSNKAVLHMWTSSHTLPASALVTMLVTWICGSLSIYLCFQLEQNHSFN